MLKKRLIATLIVRDGIVVQSIGFRRYLPVGRPEVAIEYLNHWGIDEIILLDISASKDHSRKQYDFIEKISRTCFVPLTCGGGIDSIGDISSLLKYGADKVAVNSAALHDPDLIARAAKVFGKQCIVVSIDVSGADFCDYRVYDSVCGRTTAFDPVSLARKVEVLGAGEIYLTSVDRDGFKAGFDLQLIDQVAKSVNIPVIASGGAGNPGHILEVFNRTSASAVAAANFFHFAEHQVILAKAVLKSNGVDIRLNTQVDYGNGDFFDDFRLKKRNETYLAELLFHKIEKEII